MPNHNSNAEQEAMPIGWAHIPFGIMRPKEVVPIEALPNTYIEKKEIMIHKKEHKRPSFKEAIEMGRWDKGEPSKNWSNNSNLFKHISFTAQMPAKAIQAINRNPNSQKPWPEQPSPAEVHPKERVQQQIHSPFSGCNGHA